MVDTRDSFPFPDVVDFVAATLVVNSSFLPPRSWFVLHGAGGFRLGPCTKGHETNAPLSSSPLGEKGKRLD